MRWAEAYAMQLYGARAAATCALSPTIPEVDVPEMDCPSPASELSEPPSPGRAEARMSRKIVVGPTPAISHERAQLKAGGIVSRKKCLTASQWKTTLVVSA